MRRPLALSLAAATAVAVPALATATATPAPAAPPAATVSCAELAGLTVPAKEMGLPTSGGRVTAATTVAPGGAGNAAHGAFCQVDLAIAPVDPAAPEIRMRLALPEQWNGKAVMFGGGGYNGTIPDVRQNVPFGPVDAPTPLGRGYATFASDSGHQATPGFLPTASLDGDFGLNDEAVRNFSGDALKKVRDAAVFVVREAYGARPDRTYFAGGSTGGREALAVAQRWPKDFDGVISAYPAWNAASLDLYFGYLTHVMAEPGAFPGPAEQQLLHTRVVQACDGLDGLRDGVVSDEAGCHFDPSVLACPDGTAPGATCLSREQIDAVVAASSPWEWGYEIASGETGYPGFPLLSGAKMHTPLLGFGTVAPADPMPTATGYHFQFWDRWARYFVMRDETAGPFDLDPRDPGPWLARISELTAMQDVNDPDLRPFARAGGKLLMLHGTADELVSHRSTVEYHERVRDVIGDRLAERFLRFYLVPGANHANLGAEFVASWDSLSALDSWVEDGTAPQAPVVTDGSAARGFRTRPLCEFPAWPSYVAGDPAQAASFSCRES